MKTPKVDFLAAGLDIGIFLDKIKKRLKDKGYSDSEIQDFFEEIFTGIIKQNFYPSERKE